jgi:hypothetical protein
MHIPFALGLAVIVDLLIPRSISNNPSFRLKYPGVPDGSGSSDGESDATRCPSDGSRCIPPLRRLLYDASYSGNASRCILRSPLQRQASFTLRPECGDVHVPSERHVCYTLRRGCSYAVAVYTSPGDVYTFLQPIATCRTLIYV